MEVHVLKLMILAVVVGYASAACTLASGLKTTIKTWNNCVAIGAAQFYWNYDKDTFWCALAVEGDGYVGVGFKTDESDGMWGADIYTGYIDTSGTKKFMDMISKKPAGTAASAEGAAPTSDAAQSGSLLTIMLFDKTSLLEFSRPLKAPDSEDVTITVDGTKKMQIQWATGADTGNKLNYHGLTHRGHKYMDLKGGASGLYNPMAAFIGLVLSWIVLKV